MNIAVNPLSSEDSRKRYMLLEALSPLFFDDPDIVEISVNRPGVVYVERRGASSMDFHEVPSLTMSEIEHIATLIAAYTGQFVNSATPLLGGTLPGGERVQVVLPPAAPDGGVISIRKQVISDFSLEDYRDRGWLDQISIAGDTAGDTEKALLALLDAQDYYGFLDLAIKMRWSILISGGTSSGKTTFLNACLKSVGLDERIITLEDAREVRPPQPNAVHLVASRGDQGTSKVTIQDLLEASLRMRPDRIFVGEVRGAEAFSFLQAINTGHPGSMGTVHADTPRKAYERLALMMQQSGYTAGFSKLDLLEYIRSVIPIVVQLRRENGRRGISEIYFHRGDRA